MKEYQEKIWGHSIWVTATPSEYMKKMPFYFQEAGHFYAKEDYCTKRDYHDSFLLLYTIQGYGEIITSSGNVILSQGQALLMDCHMQHQYASSHGAWEFYWIHLCGSGMEAYYQLLSESGIQPISILGTELMQQMVSLLGEQSYSKSLADQVCMEIHNMLHLLCHNLFTQASSPCQSSMVIIQQAEQYIHAHYTEDLCLDQILEDLAISKYHFIRLFKEKLGMTPYQYLTQLRIHHAKLLLRNSDLTISDISCRCGYADTSNFITHFKKIAGETPLRYRKNFTLL